MTYDTLINELKSLLLSFGYEEDFHGNFVAFYGGRTYRYVFYKNFLRKEVLVVHETTSPTKEWMRVRSGYYSDIKIENGKICGLE